MSDVAEVKESLGEPWEIWVRNDYEQAFMPSTADIERVAAAARRWVRMVEEFPTDEDVEAAALNMHFADEGARPAGYYRDLARAALSVVRARETGETR